MGQTGIERESLALGNLDAAGLSSVERTGYRHPKYAESLSEFGTPVHLPRSNGWLLARQIPGSMHWDAMGLYPLFCCDNWRDIASDLAEVAKNFVSVVLVTDPFGNFNVQELDRTFDRALHFKEHYVADLTRSLEDNVTKTNRATARRALRKVQVRVLPDPAQCIDAWMILYEGIVEIQGRSGVHKLSRESLLRQMHTPGAVMIEAKSNGELVGLDMSYVDGEFAYGHLCAFSQLGKQLRASYATRWHLLELLKGRVKYVDFGGGVGSKATVGTDSLSDYKRRWCAARRPVYLCSTIVNKQVYDQLCTDKQIDAKANYFPAYRIGDF